MDEYDIVVKADEKAAIHPFAIRVNRLELALAMATAIELVFATWRLAATVTLETPVAESDPIIGGRPVRIIRRSRFVAEGRDAQRITTELPQL